MTNQPIEEKWNWQEEFDESFDYLYQRTEVNGTECFTTQHEAVKSFIENLLEQERNHYEKELKIADERWKRAEANHREKHESETEKGSVYH